MSHKVISEYKRERRSVPKWTETKCTNRKRSSKYYGPPNLAIVIIPELFMLFCPPSVDDLIRCVDAEPPILECCVKDEFLWWLKNKY